MSTEADTCRTLVLPKLYAAGWADDQLAEQRTYTAGRIIPKGQGGFRKKPKRVDYLLRYTRDFFLAVIEAKQEYKHAADGLQQAKEYAQDLGLKFAYATNGHAIVEFDFLTGLETELKGFPSPTDLWSRLRAAGKISDADAHTILTPYNLTGGKEPYYYQRIAIERIIESFLKGQRRVLLTMATGTGKTVVAFQLCWKLWQSGWRRARSTASTKVGPAVPSGPIGKPRILYLADRTFLVDDPKDKIFSPFDSAAIKIQGGEVVFSREMYFATYQSIAKDENRPGLYKQFAPDFFDLIIVDECHRGSAKEESNWREILEYFEPACQLGMTATPMRDENRDTYLYFGNPVYTYSLRQGRDDGFLAPYRVHRIVTEWDAAGWRPSKGEVDRYGREIPDEEYNTPDFEKRISLKARTHAVARHLTDFLKKTDRFAKTIIFCVDQEHASEMRTQLNNLNADLVQQYSDYICRVTADEGHIGKGHMQRFQDVETKTPAILTTSQLLTTGLDAPTCKNVVLLRLVNSMVEFKQIIGRGTRVREDYGKLWFNILDYTGTATRNFADPAFDGEPVSATQEEIDAYGQKVGTDVPIGPSEPEDESAESAVNFPPEKGAPELRKFYFDGGRTEIAAHMVHELDPDGNQLYVANLTDYTGRRVRTMAADTEDLRKRWLNPDQRADIIAKLAERGIDFQTVALEAGKPDADPLDLLCHLGFNAPILTRRQRADRVKKERVAFFEKFGPDARAILGDLLEKYAADGEVQFVLPEVLKVPPISNRGNVPEIIGQFGGVNELRAAVNELQTLLYAA
jgi:type I restriction enzyme, R subunit